MSSPKSSAGCCPAWLELDDGAESPEPVDEGVTVASLPKFIDAVDVMVFQALVVIDCSWRGEYDSDGLGRWLNIVCVWLAVGCSEMMMEGVYA